jgi:hypothetical protein
MADETPTPTPEPAPAPAPVEAVAPVAVETPPSPTPEPEADARSVPEESMWDRMRDQIGTAPEADAPATPEIPPRPRAPREPRATPPAEPVAPAGPKKWAGRFDTPEALETAYGDAETARTRAETERQRAADAADRLERLLQAAWRERSEAPAAATPGAPQPPTELSSALAAVNNELQLLAVGDPQGDTLRLVRAVAWASQQDAASRRAYADVALSEYDARASQAAELETLRQAFFTQYPDVKAVRPSLLRQVALETEQAMKATRGDYGTPQFMRDWFAETARVARAELRLSDGAPATPSPPANPARPAPATSAPRSAKVAAPFSEAPSSRTDEPVLTGQEKYLARVFGPR